VNDLGWRGDCLFPPRVKGHPVRLAGDRCREHRKIIVTAAGGRFVKLLVKRDCRCKKIIQVQREMWTSTWRGALWEEIPWFENRI